MRIFGLLVSLAAINISVIISLLIFFSYNDALKSSQIPVNLDVPTLYHHHHHHHHHAAHHSDGRDGFAVCLLVKDVNHWLPEWVAYHYQYLPMKTLIVAVDPHSIQSPRSILERFNASNSGLDLNIDLWYDEDYLTEDVTSKSSSGSMPPYPPLGAPPDLYSDRIRQRYLHRQNHFISACLAEVKRRNETEWALLHDADEFVRFNRKGHNVLGRDLMPRHGEGTLVDFIQATQHNKESPFYSEACIPIPRLLFGSKESTMDQISTYASPGFDPHNFNTLRFRYHVKREDTWKSGFVKPIINVRRSPSSEFQVPATNPHCPYAKKNQICKYGMLKHMKVDWSVNISSLVMNHYVGSWEAFSFGRRWFLERFNETRNVSGGQSDEIRPWLSAFVRRHGAAKARVLLEGSCDVDFDYGPLNDKRLGIPYGYSDENLEGVLADLKKKKELAKEAAVNKKKTGLVKNLLK